MTPEIPEIKVGEWYETRDINLAAFLRSQGCRLLPEMSTRAMYRDRANGAATEVWLFRFERTKQLYELAALWNDPDVIEKQPAVPESVNNAVAAAAVRAYKLHRESLLDAVSHAKIQHIIKDGRKVYYIPDDLTRTAK